MIGGCLRPLRIALVGVGKVALGQHVPAIRNDPRFDLVATASRDGAIDGVPAYPCMEALLNGGHELDAVALCTPPAERSALVKIALAAGLDVMMEKPPATTLAEVAAIEANAAEHGRVVFAAWHSREAAAIDTAKAWLRGRQIQSVDIVWREDIRRWHPGQDWILAESGFGVFDPGINAFSILTALLPGHIAVERAELRVPKGRGSPIAATVQMHCGGIPITGELDFLTSATQQWDIVIETDGGSIDLTEGGQNSKIDGSEAMGTTQQYARLYARFYDLIKAGKSEIDASPLRLVIDALQIGRRVEAPAFSW